MAKKRAVKKSSSPNQTGLQHCFRQYIPYTPWVIAGIYLAVMAVLIIRHHRIGGFGVETDFYAELVPQSRALLRGEFSTELYANKGPIYSFLLAGFYLIIREYFYAGLVLNLISAGASLIAGYFLVREIFNTTTASFFIFALSTNHTFQMYTYQAGSDMPFLAFCALSLLFLFRNHDTAVIRDIVISALFACLAFLTRYNGVYIVAGAFVWFIIAPGIAIKERLKRLGIWFGIFILAGLPWYIPNAITNGNPVHNDNYVNVMMEFYGGVTDRADYEAWVDRVPEGIESLGDVIMYNPVRFTVRYAANLVYHLYFDFMRLIGWPVGILVLIGCVLLPFSRPSRRILTFMVSGAALFCILAMLFYNERFGLPLLLVYLPLALWPFTSCRIAKWITGIHVPIITIWLIVVAGFGIYAFTDVYHALVNPRPQLTGLKTLGTALAAHITDPHDRLAAREPHVAHYAGLTPRMFPEHLRTTAELVAFCHEQGIRYVAYTTIEHSSRPYLRSLWEEKSIPGLTAVVWSNIGIVFEVE